MSRVFCDSSVLIRYFVGDDPPRSLAAARLVDGDATIVVSTAVVLEVVHALRTSYGASNPDIARGMIRFLSQPLVELADADRSTTIAALRWSERTSARRIADAVIAAAAEHAGCEVIVTFDAAFRSPHIPVRML